MQGRESPVHLNHHRWLCSQGRALRNTATGGSGVGIHRGCLRTCTHSTHVRVPVCLFPPPVLLPSALKYAPRPRLLGQREPKFPDGGWGGCAKGDPVLPALANWVRHAPYLGHRWGRQQPDSPVSSSYPCHTPRHPHPLGFPGPPMAIHQQRELSGKMGRVRDPL